MENLPIFLKSATLRVVSAVAGVLAASYLAFGLHGALPSRGCLPQGVVFVVTLALMVAIVLFGPKPRFWGILALYYIMEIIAARMRLAAGLCAEAFASKTVRLLHSSFMVKVTDKRLKRLLFVALLAFPMVGILLKTIKPSSLKVKQNGTILKKRVSYATKKFLAPVGVDDSAWNVF